MGLGRSLTSLRLEVIHISSSFRRTLRDLTVTMDRRDVLKLGAGYAAALLIARQAVTAASAEPAMGESAPFSEDLPVELARQLSKAPYAPPPDIVPVAYKDLNYDQYRAIRFKKGPCPLGARGSGLYGGVLQRGLYLYLPSPDFRSRRGAGRRGEIST